MLTSHPHRCIRSLGVLSQLFFLFVFSTIPAPAQEAESTQISGLIDQLKDPDNRDNAAAALVKIGKQAVPQLTEALKDSGSRYYAAAALGEIGEGAQAAIPQLIETLKVSDGMDPGEDRAMAATAIGKIKLGAVGPLILILKNDTRPRIRNAASMALGQIGAEAREAVPILIAALKDADFGVRYTAAVAIGQIKEGAVPQLIAAFKDPNANVGMQIGVANALSYIGEGAKEAGPLLISSLKASDDDLRWAAAHALGKIGFASKNAVTQLTLALEDSSVAVREAVAESLAELSTTLVEDKATDFSAQLKVAGDIMQNSKDPEVNKYAKSLHQASDHLRLLWWVQLKQWVVSHRAISAAIAVYPLLCLVWLALLWLRPLWLLHINEALAKTTEIKLPAYLSGVSVAPRYLFLVGFFHYQSRVLDAWVAKYIDSARERFSSLPTVAEREIYVPLPVVLGNEPGADLSPDKLRPIFSSNIICLQVWGEGGSGKTALTCRLARWAMSPQEEARLNAEHLMLPVLIEQDLVIQDKQSEHPLFRAIKQQVKLMTNEDDSPPAGLLQQLLKKRRVVVIIDGISEMNEASRAATLAGITDLPVNAVIITTRTEEQLTGLPRTEIKPLRVRGNRLSTFMEAYLTARKKRDLFDDDEFFDSCRRLSLIVGDRDITALLAKLYAEQMIAVKEGATDSDAPENIPELMLSYLNDLSRDTGPNDPDIHVVHRAAKNIAWECLKKTLKPTPAKRLDVLSALGGEEEGKLLLRYLEEKLKVVQTVGAGRDRIRFALDPLAEYLAGMHLVAENGEDEDTWREFLAQVDEQEGAPEDIKGFLLALRDCCLAQAEGSEGLRKVADELAQRAGINAEESDRYRIERRVRQLRTRLKSADVVDRDTAAGQLASFGLQARPAIKELCALLRDQNANVRSAATVALGFAGKGTQEIIPHLVTALKDEDVDVRRNAADALGRSGELAKEAVPHLIETLGDADERVRKSAVGALGDIGPDAKRAAPHLAERLEDSENSVRGYAAIALGQIGESTTDVIIQLSKGLKDSDRNVRKCAATALENIGERAREAVPYLIEALKDTSSRVRSASAKALRAIGAGAEDSVSQLIDDLRNPNEGVRQTAAYALAETGFRTHEVIPQLLEAMKNSDANVRGNAAYALGTIGPAANDGVPHLIEALKDPDEKVRTNSVYALAKMGVQATGAVPALNKALEDLDQGVRLAASVALAKIGEVT